MGSWPRLSRTIGAEFKKEGMSGEVLRTVLGCSFFSFFAPFILYEFVLIFMFFEKLSIKCILKTNSFPEALFAAIIFFKLPFYFAKSYHAFFFLFILQHCKLIWLIYYGEVKRKGSGLLEAIYHLPMRKAILDFMSSHFKCVFWNMLTP